MPHLFNVEGYLQKNRNRLEEFASHSHKYDVRFARRTNKNDSLDFTVQRKGAKIKGVSPRFFGTLTSSGPITEISGEMSDGSSGTSFIKFWCYGVSVFGSLALSAAIVLSIRTRVAGYVDEPSAIAILPVLLIFAGLFFASIAAEAQRKEPAELLRWLCDCFDVKVDEETIEKFGTLKNMIDLGKLGRRVLQLSAVGLVVGGLFGFMADVEENLDPLRAPISNFHTCTKSDDGSSFIRKGTFRPTEVLYGCGDIEIEIVDQREVKIPYSLHWEHRGGDGLSGFITHEVNSAGEFMLPLKPPVGGSYPTGEYLLTLSRGGGRAIQDRIRFEVVE